MTSAILAYLKEHPHGAFTLQVARRVFNVHAPERVRRSGGTTLHVASTSAKLNSMRRAGLVGVRHVYVRGVRRTIWSLP